MNRKALIPIVVLLAVAVAAQFSFTPEQQKQFAQCTAAAQRVQSEARGLRTLAAGPDFTAENFKVQVTRLREAYAAMHEQHKALLEPLPAEQSKAVEQRKKTMDQACTRIRASLKELELAAAAPSAAKRQATLQAQSIVAAMEEWQREHRAIGEQMGVKQ